MQFLFSTASLFTYGLDRCFALAAQAGFDGIELMADQRWDTRQPAYVQTLMAQFKLPVVVVHEPLLTLPTPGWPSDEVGRLKATVALAEVLGAHKVVHHLPARIRPIFLQTPTRRLLLPWPARPHYHRWLEQEYTAFQAGTAVTLCVENMPVLHTWGRAWNIYAWNSPEQMQRFPNVTLDTTHLATWGLEPVDAYPRFQGRVRHIHLSNYNGAEHRRPEVGRLRLDAFLARLVAGGYQGTVTIELGPDALDAGQPDAHVLALLRASLAACRAWAL